MLIERHVGDVRAVDGVTFDLRRGETLGPRRRVGLRQEHDRAAPSSGCTSRPAGRIVFDGDGHLDASTGKQLQQLRRRFQMIFQDPYASASTRG